MIEVEKLNNLIMVVKRNNKSYDIEKVGKFINIIKNRLFYESNFKNEPYFYDLSSEQKEKLIKELKEPINTIEL